MKKLKAYTFIEVMLSMLLTTMVISFAYVGYTFFSANVNDYLKSSTMTFEYQFYKNRMQQDFYNAHKIQFNNSKLEVLFYDESAIIYEQRGAYMFRLDTHERDSIIGNNLEVGYLDKSDDSATSLVSSFSFTTMLQEAEIPLTAYKLYSTHFLIENR